MEPAVSPRESLSSHAIKKFEVRNGRNMYHLIPYIGNKSGFVEIFQKLMPYNVSNKKIIDVFGGSGAFAIYCCFEFGSKQVVYNDNNPVLTNFMKQVKKYPNGLIQEYEKHRARSSPQYFINIRKEALEQGLEGAGVFLYLAKNAFSGKIRFNGSNTFNAPMRKSAQCPTIDGNGIRNISAHIKGMEITTKSFEHFEDIKDSFLYLDPPYMGNPNGHYNDVPSTKKFVEFVEKVSIHNDVMISEQNTPKELGIIHDYTVYDVVLQRSLQYVTQKNSHEIIAINYKPDTDRPSKMSLASAVLYDDYPDSYYISEISSQAARGGFQNEAWVADQFRNRSPDYGAKWLEAMGHLHPKMVNAQTTRKMGFFNKADVLVLVDNSVEWVSVKKFTPSSSFNQIDKRWVSEFAKRWKMSDDVINALKMYCGEDGYRPNEINEQLSSRDTKRFFMDELSDEKQNLVVSFLDKNRRRIIHDVIAGRNKGAAQWVLAVEKSHNEPIRSVLVPIEAVIRHYAKEPVSITKKGNLSLGGITIQRKGGDAGRKTAQMLQFKFSPRDLFTIEEAHVFEHPAP